MSEKVSTADLSFMVVTNVNDKYISQQGQNAKFNIQYKKIFENQTPRKYNKNVGHVQCGYTEHGTESLHAWTVVCNKTSGVRCAAAALMHLIVYDD